MTVTTESVSFQGSLGLSLAGKLDLPSEPPLAFGIFAHCFTCSMEIHATRRICLELAARGVAMLRFDFTGLGKSQGAFEDTNFETNIQDIIKASEFLEQTYAPPKILIGHSLGGSATLFAAPDLPLVRAVVTLNAPCDPFHVSRHFQSQLPQILREGAADIEVSGRLFRLKKHFVSSLNARKIDEKLAKIRAALLVCHAPRDRTVSLEHAAHIFTAAKHPKSFISLDDANHLITAKEHAVYIADVIKSWASKYF